VLGAFAEGEWRISESRVEPGQQLVITTDGIVEAEGPDGRFGELRLRAELAGAGNPAGAVQRLEGALRDFTADTLDDDVAILAVARSSGAATSAALVGGYDVSADG
jgi:serine phosphatase RsbU (regulator of sigma subunit)